MSLPRRTTLTSDQSRQWDEAQAAFMKYCPFFCYYFYDQLEVYFTEDIPTAATDARRVFVNPTYFGKLKPLERAFALAHEVYHCIYKHPQRMKFYRGQGHILGLPFSAELFNVACDYPINADLVDNKLGICNPAWLYDPQIKGDEVPEDVYKKLFKQPPPPPPGGKPGDEQGEGTGGGGTMTLPVPPKTHGEATGAKRGHDQTAQANGGRMDSIMEPVVDPSSGRDDVPSDMEFKEAVARAVDSLEKSKGSLPGGIERLVKEILEPQVEWREHIRMLVTGKVGHKGETWARPNRRRLVLSSMGSGLPVYLPGRNRYGCELVVCAVDNSGSISERELSLFFGEMNGILADCRPKTVMVIWCDAQVHRVAEASCLEELAHIRQKGSKGGGGTSFIPVFKHLEENKLKPDTLVYLTDMYGSFPREKPTYPVIWAATTDEKAPFGDVVRVKV